MKKFLNDKKIAISISESEELNKLGFSDTHIKDAMIEFARHLLIQGATLVYGGDLRQGGFTGLFSDLAEQYRLAEASPFRNYFSFPIHINISKADEIDFKYKKVEIIRVGADETLGIDETKYVKPDSPQSIYIWAKCLTKMRHEMNEAVDARIVIGGRNYGYKGKYPGIVEEAQIAIKSKKHVFLVGNFGGAARNMIQAITEKKDVIDDNSPFYLDTDYKKFRAYYNDTSMSDKIDFEELNGFFKNLTFRDLNNGLDEKENERLFSTPHLPEIIYLVLKGLKSVLFKNS
jgi:hypothetical protein